MDILYEMAVAGKDRLGACNAFCCVSCASNLCAVHFVGVCAVLNCTSRSPFPLPLLVRCTSDIRSVIATLRHQRNFMVQSLDQFCFLYTATREMLASLVARERHRLSAHKCDQDVRVVCVCCVYVWCAVCSVCVYVPSPHCFEDGILLCDSSPVHCCTLVVALLVLFFFLSPCFFIRRTQSPIHQKASVTATTKTMWRPLLLSLN